MNPLDILTGRLLLRLLDDVHTLALAANELPAVEERLTERIDRLESAVASTSRPRESSRSARSAMSAPRELSSRATRSASRRPSSTRSAAPRIPFAADSSRSIRSVRRSSTAGSSFAARASPACRSPSRRRDGRAAERGTAQLGRGAQNVVRRWAPRQLRPRWMWSLCAIVRVTPRREQGR